MKGYRKLYVKPNIPVEAARRRKAQENEAMLSRAMAAMIAAKNRGASKEEMQAAFNRAMRGEPDVTVSTETQPAEESQS